MVLLDDNFATIAAETCPTVIFFTGVFDTISITLCPPSNVTGLFLNPQKETLSCTIAAADIPQGPLRRNRRPPTPNRWRRMPPGCIPRECPPSAGLAAPLPAGTQDPSRTVNSLVRTIRRPSGRTSVVRSPSSHSPGLPHNVNCEPERAVASRASCTFGARAYTSSNLDASLYDPAGKFIFEAALTRSTMFETFSLCMMWLR